LETLIEIRLLIHVHGRFIGGPFLFESALPGRLHLEDFNNVRVV